MPPHVDQDFAALYEGSYDRIYRLCRGYCGDVNQAEDLTQEVFLRAWQAWESFEGRSQPYTWLYRIAVNTCLMERRKKRPYLQSLQGEHHPAAEPAQAEDPQVAQLYHFISQLPEADRLAISLVLEQVPYAEIATTLGITENSLRVRIHRIKKRLAQSFQHETV